MAHVLSITDGTTTFSITSGSTCYLINYAMASPTLGEASLTETINLMVTGANGAAVQTNTATLERLLDSARRRRMESYGPRVYLQVQLDSDGSTWRSEIYDARLDIAEDGLAVWANAKLMASLYVERAPFWEGALTHGKTGRSFVLRQNGPGSGVELNAGAKVPEGIVAPTWEQLPSIHPADDPIQSAIHGWSHTRRRGMGSTVILRCFGLGHELRIQDAGSFCFRAEAQGRGEEEERRKPIQTFRRR